MKTKNVWIAGLLCALTACGGPAESEETAAPRVEDIASETAAVQAGTTVPFSVALTDVAVDGVDSAAYTPHGFVFRAAVQTTRLKAIVDNHANAPISFNVSMQSVCRVPATGHLSSGFSSGSYTVQPGGEAVLGDRCTAGEIANNVVVSFWNIDTTATDIGYQDTVSADIVGIYSTALAPTVNAVVHPDVTLTSKTRVTWGSAEIINRGSSPVSTSSFDVHVNCASSGTKIKSYNAIQLTPGQLITATMSCPSGDQVVSTGANVTFRT